MISIRRLLTKNDLANVYAATQKHLSLTDRVDVVSFAGIGECSLNVPSIFAFARNAETPAQGFSFTTVGIRPHFVTHVSELAREVNIKLLQVSLLHHSPLMLSRYINRSFSRYDLNALVERGLEAGNLHIRFNFVLMAGFNDGEDCINQIDARISPLRERCSVRISRLNETPVSRDNRLLPTTPERVHEVAALFQGRGYDAYAFMSESNDDMNCGQLVWRQYS